MYRRKLLALNHAVPDSICINNDKEFRNLVVWIEDQKIRHYKVEDRSALRATSSTDWTKAYNQYLKDLACPITSGIREEEIEWLLTFSVKLEYGDNIDKYKNAEEETKVVKSGPKVVSENPLDNLDFQSPEFVKEVNQLASLLQIDKQPNHLLTLNAISKVVSKRLNPKALENPNSIVVKGVSFPFEDADSGFDMKDPVLKKAAKILRLLHIQDLRQLQTGINECIVAVQSITANPKTDTKLGQVGRM